MDRAWQLNAGSIPPSVPGSYSIGFPQEGDPNLGTVATRPGLWWFHSITEEIRNVIIGAGFVPDANSVNQLLAAVVQIADAAAVGGATNLATLDPVAAAQLVASLANSTTALAQSASAQTAAAGAITTANAASSAASAAQTSANSALSQLTTIASDNILASVEKGSVILDYANITNEQAGIDAQAVAYGITTQKTAYDAAITALTAYLAGLTSPVAWNDVSGNTTIVGTTFRTNFATVYTTRQTLLNQISTIAQSLANTAQSTASTAAAAAATAISTANSANSAAGAAVASANSALSLIANIGSDNILSPGEKPAILLDYNTIIGEQAGIDAQATAYSVNHAAYDVAVTALTAYLGTLSGWNTIPGADVVINGTNFRANFQAVYNTKQAVLNSIAAVAGTIAQWAGVGGSGKPSDNATSDLLLIARNGCVVGGNVATKVGGAFAWDSDVYSLDSYVGGVFAAAVPTNAGVMMFGINTDPATDSDYATIDYAWYMTGIPPNNAFIYESGSGIPGSFTYVAGDVFAVSYDGFMVTYTQNGVVRRTVARAYDGARFSFDSSFYSVGAQLKNIRFGPMSSVANIGTGQLAGGAVNETYIVQDLVGISFGTAL